MRREKKKDKEFFFECSSISKLLLKSRRCLLTRKAWRSKRIEEKTFDCVY